MKHDSVLFDRGVEIVCSALIRNAEGKILLTKSPKWSNKWTLPGGHIEPGETILDAGLREAREETGLRLRPVKILVSGELINSKDFHRPAHFIYFDCVYDAVDGDINLQDSELSEARWVTSKDALQLDLAESYEETIKKYIEAFTLI